MNRDGLKPQNSNPGFKQSKTHGLRLGHYREREAIYKILIWALISNTCKVWEVQPQSFGLGPTHNNYTS